MKTLWHFIVKELAYRQWNSLLSGIAVVTPVALIVAYVVVAGAARRETTRVVRDLGFNLRIIPQATDLDRFWAQGYSDLTMPGEYLNRLASYRDVFLTYNHLVATLQRRFTLSEREVILTGMSPALTAPAQRKQPMGFAIKPGTVYLGFQVAQRLRLKKGDSLDLGGTRFTVAQCLAESGTDDDIRVFGLLSEVQQVLKQPGRINEIKAIDCLCLTADQDPLRILRTELEKALPDTKILQLRTLADARARQRQMVDRIVARATPLLLVLCGAGIAALAVLNVRERQTEIGILRALGCGSMSIATLFLGKAALIGLAGALIGYGLGMAMALRYGSSIFQLTAPLLRFDPLLLGQVLILAPLLTALASFIPAMVAVAQDPAETLRER